MWLNRSDAVAQQLAYVNDKKQAVMRVDNTTNVPWNYKRNSVRIESRDVYGVGSLWIIDIAHVPYGCSVSVFTFRSRFSSVTRCDLVRFGPHFGHMVSSLRNSCYITSCSLTHLPTCLSKQARNGLMTGRSTSWVTPILSTHPR